MSGAGRDLTWRFWRVWRRDFLVNRGSWAVGFLVPLLEPVLYVTAFGLGMCFTSILRSIDAFNLPIFLFVTPMFLFSGTFFPVESLPVWAQYVAHALPLTHLVDLTRAISFGRTPALPSAIAVAYLLCFALIVFPLSLRGMRKRLVH